MLNRRCFLSRTAFLTAVSGVFVGEAFRTPAQSAAGQAPKFRLRYAPHPGTFKASAGDDGIDQIKFAADQGFTGWEDNGLPGQPPEMQEKIGKSSIDLGMKMGVFVAYAKRPIHAGKNST